MKYHHRFRVKAPLSQVASFHHLAASMSAITPPPIRVKVHKAPAELFNGDEMDFSLCIGPFSLRWLARIEDVTEAGFTDRQLHGPFQEWSHTHSFNQVDANVTEVIDQISAQLKRSIGGCLVGLGMWLGIPLLFVYRGWKTRAMLEK